jgi:hypothetical protein
MGEGTSLYTLSATVKTDQPAQPFDRYRNLRKALDNELAKLKDLAESPILSGNRWPRTVPSFVPLPSKDSGGRDL